MSHEEMERKLSDMLTEGPMEKTDPKMSAIQQLSPKYESRTAAKQDPIVEETKIVRSFTKDDETYDHYDPERTVTQ